MVKTADLAFYGVAHRSRQGDSCYDSMMDFNNDLAINTMDLWIFKIWYFSSEGPGPGAIDQTDDPQLAYIHFEHRGAPIAVSDEAGEMMWQAYYQPFGEVEELTDVDGDGEAFALNLRYPGQYHDRESGYYYNVFRYYDPLTGRYITSDPIGLEGGLNSYLYAGSNPLLYTDPDGRISMLGMLAHPMVWGPPALMTAYWMYTYPGAVQSLLDAWHNESADGEADDCPDSGREDDSFDTDNPDTSNPFRGEPGDVSQSNNSKGNKGQERLYGEDGYPDFDIDYDHSHGDSGMPHGHQWDRPSDGGPPTNSNRGPGLPL